MRKQGRYLLPTGSEPRAGGEVRLEAREARHLLASRRAKPGDRLELFDGRGTAWEAELVGPDGEAAVCRVLEALPPAGGGALRLSLAVAVPRPKRMTFLVEKCAELGVEEILPVSWRRSARPASAGGLARWSRVAQAAAKQSRRATIMHVAEPLPAPELAGAVEACDRLLVLDPTAESTVRPALRGLSAGARILALIGPEGGLTDEDLAGLDLPGEKLRHVTLGAGVLRVETAAVAVAAIVLAEALEADA
jgi:16S rRNA (uracil1498-N3)-methyltransferase